MKNIIYKKIIEKLNNTFNPLSSKIINESHMHNVPKDSESHFKIVIVSDTFIKESMVNRHKSIYKSLGKLMNDIHALSIHAFDEEEFKKNPMVLESPQCANKK